MERYKGLKNLALAVLLMQGLGSSVEIDPFIDSKISGLPYSEGELVEVDLKSGLLVIDEQGEAYFFPAHPFLILNGIGNVWSYRVWGGGEGVKIPVEKLGKEEVHFKPVLICDGHWSFVPLSKQGMGEVDCGIDYVSLEPADGGQFEVKVHFNESGNAWRALDWAGDGIQVVQTAWSDFVDKICKGGRLC